jgi:hypothetical protein
MGPLRGGITLSLLASPVWAEVCDKERPYWDGSPVNVWQEPLHYYTSPAGWIVIVPFLVNKRWIWLLTTVLWLLNSVVLVTNPDLDDP